MLGERLFPLIQRMHPDLAGKITGMLLEIDNSELLHMLESQESLKLKVCLIILLFVICIDNLVIVINASITLQAVLWFSKCN